MREDEGCAYQSIITSPIRVVLCNIISEIDRRCNKGYAVAYNRYPMLDRFYDCSLRGHPSSFNVFVANRTSEIQRKFPIDHWQHVTSEDNPADCASRGITAQQLLHHKLWWTGPQWLKNESSTWPQQPKLQATSEEMRTRVNMASFGIQCWDIINKYSSWNKLIRITAYCVRFTRNCRMHPSER